ncbi:MAG TPA: hypothetical protein VFK69_13465 [Candidatus Eisenbacteria bacterium]|nr:hypothetical protein [Candidatus Eisenbacteria bacterium]
MGRSRAWCEAVRRVGCGAIALVLVLLAHGCALLPRERPSAWQPPPRAQHARQARTRTRAIEARAVPTARDSLGSKAAPRYTLHARRTLAAMMAQDTLFAHAAVRRCSGRSLLPESENTRDAVRALLVRTRAAIGRGDIGVACSYARDARQLAASLDCR